MPLNIFIVGLSVTLAASLLGVLVVLRRLALVSDALSHVALPGLAVALALRLPPFLGAFAFLALAVLFIQAVQKKFDLGTETLVGILFTAALAIGILITPQENLLEALFGDISQLTRLDSVIAVLGGAGVVAGTLIWWRQFLKVMISPELALGEQVNVSKANVWFLMLLTLTVAIGIKAIGTLLMGALVILPAATAKNWSKSLRQMSVLAVLIGLSSVTLGFWLSGLTHWPPGPTVVLLNSVLFAVSLLF